MIRLKLPALPILIAINILNFYDRYLMGALTEPIRKEFHLTDTQIGLIGSAFVWLYSIVGLPLGRLADKSSRRNLLAGGVTTWSALTACTALVSSYSMLLVSRLGFAIGEAVVAPAATSWIGDLFPPGKRSRALAAFMAAVPIGAALSYLISGPVAQAFGWRASMVVAVLPAMVIVPLLLMLKEPLRGACDIRQHTSERNPIGSVLRIPTFWWIVASGALLNFNAYALAQFLSAFLGRIHHLSVGSAGVYTGISYAVGGIGGSVFSGWLGDAVVRSGRNKRMLCAAALALAGAPAAWFGVLAPNVALSLALLTFFLGTLIGYYGLVYSAIQDIVPASVRGIAMAVYFMCMYLCGASFGPLLTGRVSDIMARRAAGTAAMTEAFRATGLQQAMLIMPVLSILLAGVLYAGSRSIARDSATGMSAAG